MLPWLLARGLPDLLGSLRATASPNGQKIGGIGGVPYPQNSSRLAMVFVYDACVSSDTASGQAPDSTGLQPKFHCAKHTAASCNPLFAGKHMKPDHQKQYTV